MTVGNYAKKYGVAPKTVYRWIAENRLKATKKTVEIWDVEDEKVDRLERYKLQPKHMTKKIIGKEKPHPTDVITVKMAREELRLWAIKHTGYCVVQEGKDGKEWPCGTCFCHLIAQLLGNDKKQYDVHNKPVDRVNEVWRAILQIRDAE